MSLQSRLADFIALVGADYRRAHGVVTTTTTSTLVPSAGAHQFNVTAQGGALTIDTPIDTPVDGQSLLIRVKDDGTARAISWDSIFRPIGLELPETTISGKTMYVGAKWNSADSTWDILAISQEA